MAAETFRCLLSAELVVERRQSEVDQLIFRTKKVSRRSDFYAHLVVVFR